MQIVQLEEQRAREAEEWQEVLSKSRHSAAQLRLQLDQLKGEIQEQAKEYERMKLDLQHRIQGVEGELTLQRQELAAAFDCELRQREHEFNLKMDVMRAAVLSHDLKVKLLSKETEIYCQAQLQATEALRASKEVCQQIQAQLQDKEQEIKDLTAVKDNRIKELEDDLKWMGTKVKKLEDEHIQKYEHAVQALKECEAQLEAQRQAHTEQLQKADKHIVEIQENMEVLAAQTHCKHAEHQKAMEQKDETIHRLHTKVETIQTGWDEYITHISSEMVVKDTRILTLQERESKLRTELERSREEMNRYKQQLSAGLKRERALEQKQVQLELEWQRHYEDMEAKHCLTNEQLIQDLTQARDEAKAKLKGKEQELQDLTVLLHSVKNERDQAIQGLTPKPNSLASEEIHHLQEQNSILRAVVNQMRKDMESLSHVPPIPQAQPQASSPLLIQHPGTPATTSITPTAQMATGPPAQSADISSPINPAGDLFLQKHDKTSALMVQEVDVAHTESTLANIIEQSALVRQLQKENLYLQQASDLMSGGLSENVQNARSNPALLYTRLKQAASCIALLSREKQQLIEMGNRLRAKFTTAKPQEQVEPEKDSSTKKQGDQHDRLSTLEQLQYQLTTQELQYALRHRACTVAEQLLPGTNNPGPSTQGTANPWSQEHKATDRPESSKNKENTPPLSRSQSLLEMGPQTYTGLSRSQLSSEESLRSLKEVWEILDHGLSPSIFSEGDGELKGEVGESGGAGLQMMVHGTSAAIHKRPLTEVRQRMHLATTPSNITKTSRPGAPGRMSKIRNYNVKD
nr:coiled-coil domain-containing protein 57-like isoform X2 [Monopterus albus]